MEEQLYSFYQFPGSKNHWKENIFSIFWFQEMSFKKGDFVNFLPQKFMTKYGIVSTYSATFFSQKILVCLQCGQATWANKKYQGHRVLSQYLTFYDIITTEVVQIDRYKIIFSKNFFCLPQNWLLSWDLALN